jgi:hypothetical protein
MAAQAMSVLDQEQLLAGKVVTAHHLVRAKTMIARHRYDDWIAATIGALKIDAFCA